MQTFRTIHSPHHPSCAQLAQLSQLRRVVQGHQDDDLAEALSINRVVHVGEGYEVWSIEPGQGARTSGLERRAYCRLGRDYPAVLRLIEVAVEASARRIEVEIRDGGSDQVPAVTSHETILVRPRVLAFLRGDADPDPR